MTDNKKSFARQLKALWKFDYLAVPATKNIHTLVLQLKDDKWVEKEKMIEVIQTYVMHCENYMQKMMELSIHMNANATAHKMLLDHWEQTFDITGISEEMKKRNDELEAILRKEGKL